MNIVKARKVWMNRKLWKKKLKIATYIERQNNLRGLIRNADKDFMKPHAKETEQIEN